jgi:DnaA family protein
MNKQLPLPLVLPEHSTLDDYIFGHNQTLQDLLRQQREQHNQPLLYLTGPVGAGRTHLLLGQCQAAQTLGLQVTYLPCTQYTQLHPTIFQDLAQLNLVALDDIDCLAGQADWEAALFHLYNQARDRQCQLLVSATAAARGLPFQLPDLSSRLSSGITYRHRPLTESQQAQLLSQLASRQGLSLPETVSHYLLQRYTRDTHKLVALMHDLNQASLSTQRPLTIPFVRNYLLQET